MNVLLLAIPSRNCRGCRRRRPVAVRPACSDPDSVACTSGRSTHSNQGTNAVVLECGRAVWLVWYEWLEPRLSSASATYYYYDGILLANTIISDP